MAFAALNAPLHARPIAHGRLPPSLWAAQTRSLRHIPHVACSSKSDAPPTAPLAAEPSQAPPTESPAAPAPPAGSGSGGLDSIPPAKLKELRRAGLAMKDRINLGRRGVAVGFVRQIFQRWNTSEVARLYCKGKPANNMKLLVRQLEEGTGGTVVWQSGGSVFLYRGQPWPRQQQQLVAGGGEEGGASGGGALEAAAGC